MDDSSPTRVTFPRSRDFKLLTSDQRRRVLSRLRRRWPPANDRDWWHPYDAFPDGSEHLHLEASWLALGVPVAEFRRRAGLRWSRFWAIGEGTPRFDDPHPSFQGEYEVSAAFVSPTLSSETLLTPVSLDWLVYTDHNNGTYLLGAWLVETVKDLWPEWERRVWTTPFHESPPDAGDDRPWWA